MDIGTRIRSIRNRKKIMMGQMTQGTGLSKGFISKIENNITSPFLNTLQTVAIFLKSI
jgi:transcriptional regulator with XRE-family HTH domain